MIDETLLEAEEKMAKAVAVAREDFATIRTGRATAAMFNKILVDYYGTPMPINQLATFNVPEARMILIAPYDKSVTASIEKAIRDSDLGVNPTDDGNVIRVHQGGAAQGGGGTGLDPQHSSARQGDDGQALQGWRCRRG
jgi:ribosome recycling factor